MENKSFKAVSFYVIIVISFNVILEAGELKLWYDEPAKQWSQALPVGNGRLGAMVFGRADQELIQLNEDSIWAGQGYYKPMPQMLENLPQVRQLIFDGKYREAQDLAKKTMTIKNDPRFGSYRPLGDMKITFEGIENFQKYHRQLDLDTAIASTRFDTVNGTYTRELFCSYPDQVMVVFLKGDQPNQIFCEIELTRQHRAVTKAIDDSTLSLKGQCEHGGVKFGALARVVLTGGSVKTENDKIKITAADSVVLYLTANTSYYHDDYMEICQKQIDKALSRGYEKIRKDHIADHQRLFRRVRLDLGTTEVSLLPTDERLKLIKEDTEEMKDDSDLAALLFQYGRYLLIASSRPATLPANLQGIWNPLFDPPWFSDYHVNINTQMNYWPVENCNLAELAEPLYDFIDRCTKYGRIAAKERYGCRGFVLSSCTNIWAVSEMRSGLVGLWQEGAGWACRQLWEHYLFSQDKEFLAERAYPRLKEIAQFYLDLLVEHPKYGWLVSGPTISPENMFIIPGEEPEPDHLARAGREGSGIDSDKKASVSMGPTMANQIIRDIFTQCIYASEILKVDQKFRSELIEKRSRLAPMQIGKYGQLQEWLEDFEEAKPGHRHVSHLYGLQPGSQITLRGTPELAAAARKTLERRLEHGGGWTGWSAAWLTNIWARLEDGEQAYKALKSQMRNCMFDNLLDNHYRADGAVFQIDGNFGAANAVAEMLLASHTGEIHLLPALPKYWEDGYVKGLCARGGFEVDIYWQNGKLSKAAISSKYGGRCRLRYGGKIIGFDTGIGKNYNLDSSLKITF
ncbi:glycosyl hydrolase family 95 catalytic domain-containing protein [Limihaloglobus sulfuriphilus]|nr:glycoside hydrolase family 95 protein [Limihaloglobus sulfuriphilus]